MEVFEREPGAVPGQTYGIGNAVLRVEGEALDADVFGVSQGDKAIVPGAIGAGPENFLAALQAAFDGEVLETILARFLDEERFLEFFVLDDNLVARFGGF